MSRAEGKKILNQLHGENEINPRPDFHADQIGQVEKAELSLLLHSCCGPCSSSVIERLGGDYRITVFFYNPNITGREEYERRREAQIQFIDRYNDEAEHSNKISFVEGPYEPQEFFTAAAGLEEEPEGGRRCAHCFRLRLQKTAETAHLLGCECFGTTLSVSPHKDFDVISDIGIKLAFKYGLRFLTENFKKKDGYKRSIELSKKYGLYRQSYCGCKFSEKEETENL